MISTGDLKKGVTIELDGQLYQIMDYQHIKMGRGSAQVRIKLRELPAGHITERSFQAGEKFPLALLDRHHVQYLYNDNDVYYFMDVETFEQIPVNRARLGEAINYLKEGATLELLTHRNQPVGVELPPAVNLKVAETGSSYKGDTASGGTKPAKLETGLTIRVPFFVSTGDTIKVDTRTAEYLERVS